MFQKPLRRLLTQASTFSKHCDCLTQQLWVRVRISISQFAIFESTYKNCKPTILKTWKKLWGVKTNFYQRLVHLLCSFSILTKALKELFNKLTLKEDIFAGRNFCGSSRPQNLENFAGIYFRGWSLFENFVGINFWGSSKTKSTSI